uniref:Uncharacterized protein n=1 Tax=Eutreptiella gymnastica TaxID=73025 RepID=A0A7S4FNE9_9EUGL
MQAWLDLIPMWFADGFPLNAFMLTFDKPLHDRRCEARHVVCIYAPNSTWTEGRNMIAAAVLRHEQSSGKAHKYWVLADGDIAQLRCGWLDDFWSSEVQRHSPTASLSEGQYCMARVVSYLLRDEVQWAQIYLKCSGPPGLSRFQFWYCDCMDADFVALHRAAVPVLLPYAEVLEEFSWWESQAILFRVAMACLPHGGVAVPILPPGTQEPNTAHSTYPKATDDFRRLVALKRIFTRWGLYPEPLRPVELPVTQGDCVSHHKAVLRASNHSHAVPFEMRVFEFESALFKFFGNYQHQHEVWHEVRQSVQSQGGDDHILSASSTWLRSKQYQRCLPALKERFDNFRRGVPLDSLDGPRLSRVP